MERGQPPREVLRLAGAGTTMTPLFIVETDLRAGRLTTVLDDCRPRELTVHAVHFVRRRLSQILLGEGAFALSRLRPRARPALSRQLGGA